MSDFFDLEPEKFPTLDLTFYSNEALREMAYFIWSIYADDPGLMQWRSERLIPLIHIDDMVYSDED